jgi:Uma2 family endonuclease
MTAEPLTGETLVIRPLRREEFEQLVALGAFADDPVELLDGRLVAMNPQRSLHAWVVDELDGRLRVALAGRARVRCQLPIALGDDSEPEPDISLVEPGNYQDRHPSSAWLLIEVSESTLRKDREVKGPLYARAGIPEYWIVNLDDRVVEVHDLPVNGRYTRVVPVPFHEVVTPSMFADVQIRVSDFVR